jgi:hypothetical protein
MAGLAALDAQDGAIEALGGREVRDGDADVVEHPAEAIVAATLDAGITAWGNRPHAKRRSAAAALLR